MFEQNNNSLRSLLTEVILSNVSLFSTTLLLIKSKLEPHIFYTFISSESSVTLLHFNIVYRNSLNNLQLLVQCIFLACGH